jgi:CheY-like chemotaxis protein
MPTVLIVDRSPDTREILRSALESRGVCTLAAARPEDALQVARRQPPDLIVLDLEADQKTEAWGDMTGEAQRCKTPLIILGTACNSAESPPQGEFVRKPYHYGPLLRKIEELLPK